MRTALLAFVLAAASAATPAVAQPEQGGRSTVFRFSPRAIHYFTSDLDEDESSSGDVSVSRFGPSASVDIPVGSASTLTLGAEFTYSFYNFDGTGIFDDSEELLSDAYELGLSATWSSAIGEHWTYFIGGGGRLSAEAGAEISDSLTGRVFGGVGYRFSERFVLGGGIGVSTELDDDVLIVPIITAFYQMNENWMFAAGGGEAAAGRTLGATLTWQPQPDLGVSLTGAWDRREFRLDDDGPIVDGIATDSRVDIILGVNWGITGHVTLRVEGGVSVAQEYQFDDEDGDEVLDTSSDPTPFVGGSLRFEF